MSPTVTFYFIHWGISQVNPELTNWESLIGQLASKVFPISASEGWSYRQATVCSALAGLGPKRQSSRLHCKHFIP